MATINLGNIRFNWCGEYASSTQYTKDDVVGFGGSSWIARKNAKGVNPAKNEFWDLMIAGAEKPYVIGEQKLMAFRASELPFGWYFRNGDNYLLDSPQGRALNSLSANYKEDYKITIKVINGQQYINVPTAFAPDGRGYFERAVNGINRQVGSIENDAIREIDGHFDTGVVANHHEYTRGAFSGTRAINPTNAAFLATYDYTVWGYDFHASNVVPTASENRPINIGMTPAIYLGV
ncbi:hypothetical protein GYM75_06465 [Gilliamella sp. ESL0441]|uniref:hypothetical protein n=1 Tax=Gilliamella sp. ESL0441 TaxID=2704654 RepID=UPI001C69C051|nr:hypothetical protein [Gilliamella sp. ESL0441]QYN44511.1 hypothetical protein GYM75_06465 [Gilliamella sp. ESL0441]